MIPKITGNKITNSFAWLNQPYNLLDKALDKHGLTFIIDLPGMGESLITGDPGYISELIRNRDLIGGRGTQALRPLFGNDSLIILEGDTHHIRRQMLLPFFKSANISKFDQLTLEITHKEIQNLPNSFSISSVISRITLKVIIRLIFGEISAQNEAKLMRLINNYYYSFKNPLFLFSKALHFNFGRFSPWGRLILNRKSLYKFIIEEIEQRKTHVNENTNCLLDELIHSSKESVSPLSNDSIFNEVLSLLLFGHDTSAVTMAWLFHHVYQQTDILHKLQIDIPETEQLIDNINQNKSTYLKSCIQESMRLCPVVVHLTRVAEKNTTLCGLNIKKNSRVLPSAYLAHHNPNVFTQPYSFQPDRFMGQHDYQYSFFPFGFGSRKCIGEHLALRQMQLIFASFIKKSELMLDPAYPVKPERQMLLIGPSHGTMMRNKK